MSPCIHIKLPGGGVAIARVAKQRTPKCQFCGASGASLLCDFRLPDGKTCDASCSTPVGADLDYCVDHRAEKRPA